jgi:4-hydroxy-2,2'-bipyrrole-5-methanol dehydrogenase
LFAAGALYKEFHNKIINSGGQIMITTSSIKRALIKANFSPSSHNCQPWMTVIIDSEDKQMLIKQQFALTADPRIIFGMDKDRMLVSLPIHLIEMHLSCGAYIQAFLEDFGSGVNVDTLWVAEHLESTVMSIDLPNNFVPLVICSLSESAQPASKAYFADVLASRRTHRLEYKKTILTDTQINCLKNAESHLDPSNSIGLQQQIITDRTLINQFGDCIRKNADKEFGHAKAWEETYRYFRWSDKHADQCGDGFKLEHVLGPMSSVMTSIYQFVLSPTTMKILHHLRITKLLAKDMSQKFKSSDAIFLLSFPSQPQSIYEQIIAGSYLLNFWLRAESQGLSLWPCSILLQHDSSRLNLQSVFGIEGRVFFVGKLGIPAKKLSPAPRHSDPLNNVSCV